MKTLLTGEAVSLDIRPASLGARAISCAVDTILYIIVDAGIFFLALWLAKELFLIDSLLFRSLGIALTVFTVIIIPCTVEILTRGRSVGKLLTGLRVIREDGGAIAFRHAFLRSLLWQFEVLSTGGGIAAFFGLVSSRSKRLGDFLAGTIAVSERTSLPHHKPIYIPENLHSWVGYADISALPQTLMYRMVHFLVTASEYSPQSRIARAIDLAEEVNPYVSPPPPPGTHPEAFLAAIVGHHRHEALARQEASERTSGNFISRAHHLPHGLRITP